MNRAAAVSAEPDGMSAPGLDMYRGANGRPAQATLLGLSLDMYTPSGLIRRLISDSLECRGGYVVTPNLDHLRSVSRSDHLMSLALDADIRVADGMPLVWASRIQGTPLPTRVAGSDLIFSLSEALAVTGRSVYLLGGNPGTADAAAQILQRHAEGLRVVGTYCPPFGFESDSEELARIGAAVRAAQPDFVFVGLPFGKASELVTTIRRSLPSTWFLGLGVSFSFVCGEVRRAPRWMQRCGLEWLYRLIQEPRRLGRRYVLEGLPFFSRLLWSSLLKRWRSAGAQDSAVEWSVQPSADNDTTSASSIAVWGQGTDDDHERDSSSSRF
jgi:N-acetylglucosaminyldiphosphoundecaprenol N-acetyl-beta-D-mannosaminyltransferase